MQNLYNYKIPENLSMRRPNNPSSKPDFALPLTLEQADPNNLLSGFRPPTSGGGFLTDMRDRTLQDPYEIGGGGALGVQKIDGSGGGALFLPDENRPRSEEDIRNRYEQAKAQAAEQRKTFYGQVVLPGEQSFDEFKAFSGNSFFLKRNPNIPESAYSNFDLTDVGGFDTPEAADPNNLLPSTTPPTGGISSLQPHQPTYHNNMNQFKDFEKRLENIEQGVGSLLDKNQMNMSNNMGVQGYSSTGYSPNSVIGNLLRWSYR